MNEAVAKALSAERTIAGLTVRKLAEVAGIPERSLMRILQAERDIKVNQIELLAQALRLYPHEIIEHAEQILERSQRAKPDLSNVTHADFGVRGREQYDELDEVASEGFDINPDPDDSNY